ncbi:hypothetical protein [Ciceribacter sp. RN22]|uniref:hypothetical protein n=1 Tax=Ciceribacter sp. RN22 TaxID=2954932 RepID=UPI0020930946|nr:hypothetical protein [Ciceribacter sp. RN22]MCO6177493.1 hypothetical protein [Ciceribacter sp. RN22]
MIATTKRVSGHRTGSLLITLVGTGLILSGCGGREAHPVAATNPSDSAFDCAGISREYSANERQILATVKERADAQGKNIVLGVTGAIIFFPALFFMDPKSPERVEIDALRNRNKVLEDIARTKKCPLPKSQLQDLYKKLDGSAASTNRR